MKAILISIRPEWVAKILNEEKTIEIRKTAPKCGLPIDVYIYCTKSGNGIFYDEFMEEYLCGIVKGDGFDLLNGKVVAKFTLKEVEEILYLPTEEEAHRHGCYLCKLEDKFKDGFNIEEYSDYYTEKSDDNYLLFYSCLKGSELHSYLKGGKGFAWHISDLVIFDEPKELSEFKQWKIPYPKRIKWPSWESNYYTALGAYVKQHPTMMASEIKRTFDESISIKRAPQSWRYVEVIA